MTKLFWLSFCDGDKPAGSHFLGACLIEVSDAETQRIVPELEANFPQHAAGAEWLAAAARKAWALGCNPGGEIASIELDKLDGETWPDPIRRRLGTLLTRDECAAFDAEMLALEGAE